MHEDSLAAMRLCKERYSKDLPQSGRVSILDVGAMDVNGSYRKLFSEPRFAYTGVDLGAGPGVDIVLENAYALPFDDLSFDLVVSGQMLEHNEFFWLTFQEMVRVLKPDGLCFMIAPSRGEIHRYPADCYRFYPDGFRALAKYTSCQLIDCWIDRQNPWGDLTGVFRKRRVADTEHFDTGTIETIGGPATEAINLAVKLERVKKRLRKTQAVLAETEAKHNAAERG
ncbi:MAG: class I SAM-dependent methyltransferase [Pseudomonadota bacterium]